MTLDEIIAKADRLAASGGFEFEYQSKILEMVSELARHLKENVTTNDDPDGTR